MTRREMLVGLGGILATGTCPAVLNNVPLCRVGKFAPYDYEVEYLVGTKDTYIDTGIVLDSTDKVSLKFTMVDYSGTHWPIFGYYGDATSFYVQGASGDNIQILFSYGSTTKNDVGNSGTQRPYTATVSIDNGDISIAESGVHRTFTASFIGTQTAWYGRARGITNYGGGRHLYRLVVDGKCDLIPCVKDGVACFYDTISKSFKYNAGAGSFVAGPKV